MNTHEQKTEKVLQEALQLLEEGRSKSFILEAYPAYEKDLQNLFDSIGQVETLKNTKPSAELLRSALAKAPVPSPLSHSLSGWRVGISMFAVAVLLVGGITLFTHEFSTGPQTIADSSSDTSDAALSQDAGAIDNQLNGLDADQAQVDNALNRPSHQ